MASTDLDQFIGECAFAKVVSTAKGSALLIGGQVVQFAEGESQAVEMLSIALRRLSRGEGKSLHCEDAVSSTPAKDANPDKSRLDEIKGALLDARTATDYNIGSPAALDHLLVHVVALIDEIQVLSSPPVMCCGSTDPMTLQGAIRQVTSDR